MGNLSKNAQKSPVKCWSFGSKSFQPPHHPPRLPRPRRRHGADDGAVGHRRASAPLRRRAADGQRPRGAPWGTQRHGARNTASCCKIGEKTGWKLGKKRELPKLGGGNAA